VICFATNAVLRHAQEEVRILSSRRAWSCVSPLAVLSIHATTRRCPSDRFGKPDGTGLPSDAQAHSAAMVGAILPFVALIGEVTTLRDGCVHSQGDSHAEKRGLFYRKRSIPASIFCCLEVGRPENRVVPIGGYPLRLRECDTII